MRWLMVFVIACLLFSGLERWLRKIGLGRLPGDFKLKIRGRDYWFPLASCLVMSLIAGAVGYFI